MNKTYLEAGKVVATHGVRGEVKLLPWADSPEFLLPFTTLWGEGNKPYAVEESRVHGTCILLKFKGIDTVEDAALLRGKILSIRRDDPHLPQDVVFIADLVGLPVFSDGRKIGILKEVLTLPSSDVYVVRGEHEYMIPAVPAFVPVVDPTLGRIDVNLIEGMQTDAD